MKMASFYDKGLKTDRDFVDAEKIVTRINFNRVLFDKGIEFVIKTRKFDHEKNE